MAGDESAYRKVRKPVQRKESLMNQKLSAIAEKSGIKPLVLNEIVSLARRHGLSQVVLFGSRARGSYQRTSDIDLAVSGGSYAGFALDVEEETSTLLKFDVVNLDGSVQEELLHSIQREGVAVYEKI